MPIKFNHLAGLATAFLLYSLPLSVSAETLAPAAGKAAAPLIIAAAEAPAPENQKEDATRQGASTQSLASTVVSLGDAVMKALKANPGIMVQQEKVIQGEGLLQSASGQFDWIGRAMVSAESTKQPLDDDDLAAARFANSLAGLPPPDDYAREDKRIFSVGAVRQFRSGVSIAPTLSTQDYDNNFDTWNAQNRSDLRIDVTVPLLRGLGAQYTAANELAAAAQLKTARYLSKHNISRTIYDTAITYWNCLASRRSFELTADTQVRSDQLLTLVERLVQAGSLEPAVLNQVRAKLFSNKIDVKDGELSLYRSRQALALTMGYTPREMVAPPDPGGDFPGVTDSSRLEDADVRQYIQLAMTQRGDYLAARTDSTTAAILLAKAENDVKPKLDLGLRVGYAGIDETRNEERYFRSLSNRSTGPNTFASLSLELPIVNNAAKGNIVYRKSLLRETELNIAGLENRIASEVLVAYQTLRATISEYQLAEQSEAAYKQAVAFETQKYRAGTSTLTAVIDIEDRYFRARVAKIDVMRKYAVALAEFRYVTGSLLSAEENILRFSMEKLVEFPPLN